MIIELNTKEADQIYKALVAFKERYVNDINDELLLRIKEMI